MTQKNKKLPELELLSIKETAKLLEVSSMTLRQWDSKGILKSLRPTQANRRRYWKSDVLNFLNLKVKKLKERSCYNQPVQKFPQNSWDKKDIVERLQNAFEDNIDYKNSLIVGYPSSAPFKDSLDALILFLPLNANNIGTHARLESEAGFKGTQNLEREAIAMIADLFNADTNKNPYDGYISSGGTEGNIEGLWILRNMIDFEYKSSAYYLTTPLTHYSARKAFDLLGIRNFHQIRLQDDFSIDISALGDKIRSLFSMGHKYFVIVCTLGYTVTGSIDQVEQVDGLGEKLEKELGIKLFIHVDASHGGFIYPFLTDNKIGFNLKRVMTISLDAHKTGLVPYSCGVFICRKTFTTLHRDRCGLHKKSLRRYPYWLTKWCYSSLSLGCFGFKR